MAVKVKRRRGRWWIYVHHKGRRKAKSVGDKQTAERLAKKLREKLVSGDFRLDAAAQVRRPFSEYYPGWLDRYARVHCKESTCAEYDSAFRVHLRPRFGERDVTDITREDVSSLVRDLLARGRARATVKAIIAPLREMFAHALEDGHVAVNPATRIFKRTRLDAAAQQPTAVLSGDELKHVLDVCRRELSDWYAFVLLLARTGLRLGEAVALQWDDIDERGRFAVVQRSYSKRRLTTPKSGKSRRVDLSRHLVETLSARRLAARKKALRDGVPLSPWVFPDEVGSRPLDVNNFRRRQWKRLFDKSKVRLVHPHVLRHTYASLLIQNGESLAYVRDQLGHHSIQITVDTYGHLVPGGNRAAVDRLDDALPSSDATPARATALASSDESR